MENSRYQSYRAEFLAQFAETRKLPESKTLSTSPSGDFQLTIHDHEQPASAWGYSSGEVKYVQRDEPIAFIKRNIGHFWYRWITHPNGCEYLLCGEDYQGYTVINLTRGRINTYFPENGYDGMGFCWTAVLPSPDGLRLAVEGCYWACPYQLVIFDFSQPETLPLRELARFDSVSESYTWIDNTHFQCEQDVEVRTSDGTPYDELPVEEQALLDDRPELISTVRKSVIYKVE